MGTWGSGNFDDDTAADHLSTITGRLLDETRQAMDGDPSELTPDEFWGVAVPCNVELLALLAEQRWVGAMLPENAVVAGWKTKYLAIWDASIDGLAPSPSFKEERRAVLVATFDRLLRATKREEDARNAPPAAPAKKPPAKKPSAKKAAPAKKTPKRRSPHP